MVLEQFVLINASTEKVWQIFVNPEISRKIGGEFVSDWQPGSPIGWFDKDGTQFAQGKILEIQPTALLRHQVLNKALEVASVITYRLDKLNESTILFAKEELTSPVEEKEKQEMVSRWYDGLNALKDLAESF